MLNWTDLAHIFVFHFCPFSHRRGIFGKKDLFGGRDELLVGRQSGIFSSFSSPSFLTRFRLELFRHMKKLSERHG